MEITNSVKIDSFKITVGAILINRASRLPIPSDLFANNPCIFDLIMNHVSCHIGKLMRKRSDLLRRGKPEKRENTQKREI